MCINLYGPSKNQLLLIITLQVYENKKTLGCNTYLSS